MVHCGCSELPQRLLLCVKMKRVEQVWNGTHILRKKKKKKLVTRFKHNRFNLVFVLGKGIYYNAKDMSYFLDTVHDTTNSLLKAVCLDIKEVLFLSGVKSFGLISEFISAPLWRKLEEPGHILEMNETFKTLTDFLKEASNDVGLCCKFIRGQVTPFNTTINEDDRVTVHLASEDTEVDKILLPLLQSLFNAIQELLERMVEDHLPGGQFWNPTEELKQQTRSVMKYNKLPEFTFGQLDQLLRRRPNYATT